MNSTRNSIVGEVIGYILLISAITTFSLNAKHKSQANSAADTAAILLNMHPEKQSLDTEAQEYVDNQLRFALYKIAIFGKFSFGHSLRHSTASRIVAYFKEHREGKVLFPEPSRYNDRIAPFIEDLRTHPNGRDVSFLVPILLGISALAILGWPAIRRQLFNKESGVEPR